MGKHFCVDMEDMKLGDKVPLVVSTRYGGKPFEAVGVVTRVTPTTRKIHMEDAPEHSGSCVIKHPARAYSPSEEEGGYRAVSLVAVDRAVWHTYRVPTDKTLAELRDPLRPERDAARDAIREIDRNDDLRDLDGLIVRLATALDCAREYAAKVRVAA